jgi:hypothetical protein
MDTESKKNFDRIVNLEPEALSEGDVVFLKARRSYLTKDEEEKFKDLLDPKPEAKKKAEK